MAILTDKPGENPGRNGNMKKLVIPCIVASLMLILALFDMPYGYYTLLRIIVCGIGVFVAISAYNSRKFWAIYLFGFIAVLFNPLVPIHLDREIWQTIDIVCAVLFCGALPVLKGLEVKNKRSKLCSQNLKTDGMM